MLLLLVLILLLLLSRDTAKGNLTRGQCKGHFKDLFFFRGVGKTVVARGKRGFSSGELRSYISAHIQTPLMTHQSPYVTAPSFVPLCSNFILLWPLVFFLGCSASVSFLYWMSFQSPLVFLLVFPVEIRTWGCHVASLETLTTTS